MTRSSITVGMVVRIERDEVTHPSRGSWHRYRGRIGTVVAINRRDHEYGINWHPGNTPFGKCATQSWFQAHELTQITDARHSPSNGPEIDATGVGGVVVAQ